jgi:hypothetical protein
VDYHSFRGGAENQVIDATAATGPHDNQVGGQLSGKLQN